MIPVAHRPETLALVVNLPPNTRVDLSIFDVRTALPAHLRSSFSARKSGDSIVLSYDFTYASESEERADLMFALRALIGAGYLAAIEGSSIRVTKPAPIPFAEVET